MKLSEVSLSVLNAWADAGVMSMRDYVEETQRREAEADRQKETPKQPPAS